MDSCRVSTNTVSISIIVHDETRNARCERWGIILKTEVLVLSLTIDPEGLGVVHEKV